MSLSEKLLAELDEEFAVTRKMLALVPDDKLTWKPHEKSMELGRLAWHVADFPEWVRDTLRLSSMQMTPEDGERMMNGWKGKTRADLLARFDRDLAEAREQLSKASDASLAEHWKMEWGGQVMIDNPRDYVLRKWCLNHMIHHRAQLGVYFRLLGIAIPGMYGPSADEESQSSASAV